MQSSATASPAYRRKPELHTARRQAMKQNVRRVNAKKISINDRPKHHAARLILVATVGALLCCCAVLALVPRNAISRETSSARLPTLPARPALVQGNPQQPAALSINRAVLDRHVIGALNGLGDRFERPGKERSIQVAILTRRAGSNQGTSTVQIIRELSDKLRIEEQGA